MVQVFLLEENSQIVDHVIQQEQAKLDHGGVVLHLNGLGDEILEYLLTYNQRLLFINFKQGPNNLADLDLNILLILNFAFDFLQNLFVLLRIVHYVIVVVFTFNLLQFVYQLTALVVKQLKLVLAVNLTGLVHNLLENIAQVVEDQTIFEIVFY